LVSVLSCTERATGECGVMNSKKIRVGVLGLGIIGARVAENLRAAGHEVFVWNRTPKPVPNFLGSPAEVAEQVSIIQVFVRDDEALLEVLEAARPALGKKHLVMNHATVSPEATRAAAALCSACGADFLDAPFTGSKMAAQNGKLAYYIGGAAPLIERARPVLEASSSSILPMGDVGAATVVKITTNLISASIVKAVIEAAEITRAQGVALEHLLEGLKVNANFSPLIGMKLPAMMKGEFEPHFSLKNMLKDADYARGLAAAKGIQTEVLDATAALMRQRFDEGKGEQDFSIMGERLSQEQVVS
jgi:3-hydroxyisobutyrate dehydrogenase-like beta-hydroxyacid dehydrogenase